MSDVRSRCADSEAMRNLVGNATFFTDAIEQIPEIAQSEASVLIENPWVSSSWDACVSSRLRS